ncbi:hypothetical protein CRI93_05685 [Longimonas halophila]|uniref:Uncharacterized protein n=2 Tax=Longimonas halophila TaxID=1469170 RepID=A0A2H3P1V4_9BACT|nr:hypothetical protein CRI93_05685 [Longimonas halophila]
MLAAPAVVHAQEAVPLTLEYHRGLEKEGILPDSTEVLVYHEAGGSSVMLSDWGGHQKMRDVLVERADSSFSETYDRLNAEATTRSIQVPTDPRHRAYILARLPESEGTPRFYETQVGSNAATSPPELEIVESGNMNMTPVDDAAWAESTFERALEHRSTRLTLQSDEVSFNEDALVRVWTRPADEGTALSRDELSRGDTTDTALTADGTTQSRFDRTAYSGEAVYVIVRTTNTEGEPVLYESVGDDDAAVFVPVTDGNVQMQRVPDQHRTAMAAFFPEQESGGGGISWMFYGLVGGLLFVIVLILGRGLTKKKEKKNRRRQKSMRERVLNAVVPSAGDGSESAEEGPGQELAEGKVDASAASEKSNETAELQEENAELQEENAELREENKAQEEKIATLKKKLRSKNQEIQELKKQSNGAARPQSQPEPRRPSTGEKVGKAFKKWCTEGSPAMVDRYQLFGRQIESEISSASFRRIMRENNAAGLVFDDNAQDPVEYWLVEAKGTAYLLPQPTRNGFRELGECFDGSNRSPSQVRTVEPAKLKKRSSGFILEEKGRIE